MSAFVEGPAEAVIAEGVQLVDPVGVGGECRDFAQVFGVVEFVLGLRLPPCATVALICALNRH